MTPCEPPRVTASARSAASPRLSVLAPTFYAQCPHNSAWPVRRTWASAANVPASGESAPCPLDFHSEAKKDSFKKNPLSKRRIKKLGERNDGERNDEERNDDGKVRKAKKEKVLRCFPSPFWPAPSADSSNHPFPAAAKTVPAPS